MPLNELIDRIDRDRLLAESKLDFVFSVVDPTKTKIMSNFILKLWRSCIICDERQFVQSQFNKATLNFFLS